MWTTGGGAPDSFSHPWGKVVGEDATGGRDGPDDRGVVGDPCVLALRSVLHDPPHSSDNIFSPDTSACYRIRHPPGAAFAPTEFGAQRETWVRMVDGVCR